MSDQIEPDSGDSAALGSRHHVRAAALGLLALAALIAAIMLFGGGDDGSGDEASDTPPATSESAEPTEVPPSSDVAEPSESTEPTASEEPPATSDVEEPSESSEPAVPPTNPADNDVSDQTSADDPPSDALVLITSSEWNAGEKSIEVVGSVQGVQTETSTCTATATRDGAAANSALTASVDGTFDGQGTSCGLISIPVPDAKAGVYHVVITFDAGNGPVKSDPVDVTVA